MEIKVAEVINQTQIIINKGSTHGLQVGQHVFIYSIGKEIFDPDTRESLGNMEISKGRGVISSVLEKQSAVTAIKIEVPESVILKKQSDGFMSFMHGMQKTEEERKLVEKTIPFESVEVGDLVRLI